MVKLMSKCIVIGAGPGGMSAAIYLKRAGIDVILIEKMVPGGEMLKTNKIENYLGFDSIDGGELALRMSSQVKDLGVEIIRDDITDISYDNGFIVTGLKNKYQADYVIIATGRVPRKLGLDMEEELLNRGISYCATCDGAFYKGKEVAIVGGGDSALTEALYLSDICLKVYVLVRKDLKASDILQNRVKNKDNIVILKNVSVSQFISSDSLTGVLLNDGRKLDVNGLFVAIGGTPDISFLKKLNVDTINGYIKTDDKMRTNIKGLYAVGDVRYKDFYQIITAASDGAIAALSIREDD